MDITYPASSTGNKDDISFNLLQGIIALEEKINGGLQKNEQKPEMLELYVRRFFYETKINNLSKKVRKNACGRYGLLNLNINLSTNYDTVNCIKIHTHTQHGHLLNRIEYTVISLQIILFVTIVSAIYFKFFFENNQCLLIYFVS